MRKGFEKIRQEYLTVKDFSCPNALGGLSGSAAHWDSNLHYHWLLTHLLSNYNFMSIFYKTFDETVKVNSVLQFKEVTFFKHRTKPLL